MNSAWRELESTTHQDHVVAHVIGATVLGHFTFDETLHLLLDIGFIWSIYLDGQMVLLPHGVAVRELELDAESRARIGEEVELQLAGGADGLQYLEPIELTVSSVSFFENADRRRFVLSDEDSALTIEASIAEREFRLIHSSGSSNL